MLITLTKLLVFLFAFVSFESTLTLRTTKAGSFVTLSHFGADDVDSTEAVRLKNRLSDV